MLFIVLLVLLSVLSVLRAEVVEMGFSDLEKDTNMKLVLFHDPEVESSVDALAMMNTLSENPTFNAVYLFKTCTVTLPECEGAVKAGLKGGTVFTQTPEGGIDQFSGVLSTEAFTKFHDFRTTEVTDHKVVRVDNLDGLFAEAEKKPVLIKMYEEW